MSNLRIALVICMADTGEEVCTRYVKPSRLMNELAVIQDRKAWVITETYIANRYGMRMEEEE